MSDKARLFVALELPRDARHSLEAWRVAATASIPGLRSVPFEAIHATLCFLGWRPAGEADAIGEACAGVVMRFAAPELVLADPVWLPARRPRVLAVRLEDRSGALARVQAELSAALSDRGWYTPETRPFLAHVTVARVPRAARMRAVELEAVPSLGFTADAVTLYRSHLGGSGARYEALRTMPLGAREP